MARPKPHIGEFEEIVLLAIAGMTDDIYAVTIQEHIESETERETSLGSLYRTLNRLEDKGLVTSRMGRTEPIRGGKRKRLYEITVAGRAAVIESRRIRDRLWTPLHTDPAFLRTISETNW